MDSGQKDLFIEAMTALHPEEIGNYFDSMLAKAIRRDVAIQRFGEIVGKVLKDEEKLYPVMRKRLSSKAEIFKKYIQRDQTNLDLENFLDITTEQLINYVSLLPKEARKKLIDNELLYSYNKVLNTQKEPDIAPRHSRDYYIWEYGALKEQYLGDNIYKIFLRGSWMELQLNPDETVIELDRYIDDQKYKGLIPHFAWVHVKNTGQRLYLSSKVPQ